MNVAWPFADAALKENVKFDKNLVKDGDVDKAVLMKPLGGDLEVRSCLILAKKVLCREAVQVAWVLYRSVQTKAG